MARPRKSPVQKRNTQRNLRFTLEEDELLRVEAAKAGLSVSEYIRALALKHRVSAPASRRADPALISELNRIGVNVNQLARAVHTGRKFAQYWKEVGVELERVLKQVVSTDGS